MGRIQLILALNFQMFLNTVKIIRHAELLYCESVQESGEIYHKEYFLWIIYVSQCEFHIREFDEFQELIRKSTINIFSPVDEI